MNRCCQRLRENMKGILFQALTRTVTSYSLKPSIKGRDFLDVFDFTVDELKYIIWTALDLKTAFKNGQIRGRIRGGGMTVTSLLCSPCAKNQLAIEKASEVMGVKASTIIDKQWEGAHFLSDTGRLISTTSHVVLASALVSEQSLCELAAGATVPVINLGSPHSNPLTSLAYAMTILTHLDRLERIRIAWVGPSDSSVLGSLLHMMPKFRTHLHMSTENCNPPVNLEKGLKLASAYRSEIHHASSPEQAAYRADVIISTSHSFKELQITKKLVDEAALNWIFLHDLPRTGIEVTDDVFCHRKNSLVWEAAENRVWALLAVILRVLTDYEPTIPAPSFTEECT